jgi:hypothetical protein
VLYRKMIGDDELLGVENERPTTPVAAIDRVVSTVASDGPPVVCVPATAANSATPSRSSHRRTAVFVAMGLAVAICVALFVGRPFQHRDRADLVGQATPPALPASPAAQRTLVASNSPSLPVPDKKAEGKRTVETGNEGVTDDFEPASLDLASRPGQSVTASVPAPHSARNEAATTPAGDDDRWVDDVGRQFQPMGSNLSQAFHFLWEAVPAKKAPSI